MNDCVIPIELCIVIANCFITDIIQTMSCPTIQSTILRSKYRVYLRYATQTNKYLWRRILLSMSDYEADTLAPIKVKLALSARYYLETVTEPHLRPDQIQMIATLASPQLKPRGFHEIVIERKRRHGFTTILKSFLGSIREEADTNQYIIVTWNGRASADYRKTIKDKFPIFSIHALTEVCFRGEFYTALVCVLDIDITFQNGKEGEITSLETWVKPYAKLVKILRLLHEMYEVPVLIVRPHHIKVWTGQVWF